jgi:hypothetical protein
MKEEGFCGTRFESVSTIKILRAWKRNIMTWSNVSDAEEFARNHPARVVEDFAAHLNLAYSIQEKQTAREQIRIATASSLAG